MYNPQLETLKKPTALFLSAVLLLRLAACGSVSVGSATVLSAGRSVDGSSVGACVDVQAWVESLKK